MKLPYPVTGPHSLSRYQRAKREHNKAVAILLALLTGTALALWVSYIFINDV